LLSDFLHQEVRVTKADSGVKKVTAVCRRRSLGNSILEHEDLVDI
jgi:hypothetical protein